MRLRLSEVLEPVAEAGGAGVIVLEVDRLPTCNTSDNRHWRSKTRDRAEWGMLMRAAWNDAQLRSDPFGCRGEPIERAHVVFIRRSSREPDSDNLIWSFKAVRDLLQPASKRNPRGLGLIVGDDPQHLEAEYRWEKAPRGKGSVQIEVSEASVDPEGDDEGDEVDSQYG